MTTAVVVKRTIFLFTTPEQLRALADAMEKKIPTLKIGDECTIHTVRCEDHDLKISWDQK